MKAQPTWRSEIAGRITKALVDRVKEKHGRLDGLYINAGVVKVAGSEQVDEETFNINVRGAYFLLKHLLRI